MKTGMDSREFQLNKRIKHQEFGAGSFPVAPVQSNPPDEPGPLGLKLRKDQSLLDLIQMRLSEGSASSTSAATDKLKVSNFPASLLKIGTWEYKSRYEGDLVAKCYFARHKLVWEFLDGGLKNKIEIQWSDIMTLKASYPDNGPGILNVVLTTRPLFFRETNPQPRKHTIWQATADFTGGQASLHRCHCLQCPQGLLGKHFEKIQCDPYLKFLSQQPEVELESPYFEPMKSLKSAFDEPNETNEYDLCREGRPTIFDLQKTASPSGVMGTSAIEGIRRAGTEGLKDLSHWDHIKVPGIHPSMSMTDLVNHVENRIKEQRTSSNHPLSREEKESLQILEDISRCLINGGQYGSTPSDEESVMSKVKSLCSLLQKDPTTFQDLEPKTDCNEPRIVSGSVGGVGLVNEGTGMSMQDSIGDLMLNLPRIESLPHFFRNSENELVEDIMKIVEK